MASIDPAYIEGSLEIRKLNGAEGDLSVAGTVTANHYVGHREEKTITGDGENVNFYLTHTLGIRYVNVTVYDSSDNLCLVAVNATSIGNFVVTFAAPPAQGASFKVVIL